MYIPAGINVRSHLRSVECCRMIQTDRRIIPLVALMQNHVELERHWAGGWGRALVDASLRFVEIAN